MASEWPLRALADISTNFDTQRKPVRETDRVAGPYPYYGASGIVDYVDGYLFDGDYLLVAEDGENLRTRNTPIAFRATGKFWVNNHAHILQGNEEASTRFLNYALLAADVTAYLTGAVMPKLTQGNLNRIKLPCPPPEVQDQIVSVLGALDDRIDNLHQTNATLQAIAGALFKSRFVDFDSVPQEDMQPSELDLIPKGWQVASLSEHLDADRGLSYKGAGLAEAGAGVPMHNLNSVLEFGGYKYAGIKHYTGEYKDKHLAVAGDIIVANTEQGHEHRLIGFPAIVPRRYASGLYSHHLYRVRIKDDSPLTREWLYHCLMTPVVREQVIGCANGSTVNMLKPDGLRIPRFVLPPHELCGQFDAVAEPLRQKSEANVEQAVTLSALRESLLPRLVSGQLRVQE
jgi:type I restriction enzyme S subunit